MIKKSWSLEGRPDENSGRPWNLIHNLSCRPPCRLFIHEVFFRPLGRHLRVWSELNRLRPFNQWELLDCNGHGPSVLCVKWPLVAASTASSSGFKALWCLGLDTRIGLYYSLYMFNWVDPQNYRQRPQVIIKRATLKYINHDSMGVNFLQDALYLSNMGGP